MNLLTTDTPARIRAEQLTPRQREGPARVLFLLSDVLGWKTSSQQLIRAAATRGDITAVHAVLRPPLWMRVLNRRVPRIRHHLVAPQATWQWQINRWLTGPLDPSRFDVIHCNPQMLSGAAARLKSRFGYKLSMACDTTDTQFNRELSDQLVKGKAQDREYYAAADLILPLSRWAAKSLTDDYGVDPARLQLTSPSAPVPTEITPREPRSGRLLRIAFVGNDFNRKGGPQLLKWHQERWADRTELHVASADAANHPPAKNVIFHGRLDHSAVLAMLDRADILIHPTQADMSALVVAEAAARGVPAVASRLAGIPDLIDDGVSGLLIDPADEAGFIAAAESVLFDEHRHAAMSAAARQFALDHLDSSRTYDRVMDHLVALADARR